METGTHRPVMRLEVPKKKEGKQETVTEKDNENDMQTNFEGKLCYKRFLLTTVKPLYRGHPEARTPLY